MTRATTHDRLDQALTGLLVGQPAVTDGELTVTNLCKEAGVGRDSCYRTPAAVARFTTATNTAATPGTELARLRDQVGALNREIKDLKREHAARMSELVLASNSLPARHAGHPPEGRNRRPVQRRLTHLPAWRADSPNYQT